MIPPSTLLWLFLPKLICLSILLSPVCIAVSHHNSLSGSNNGGSGNGFRLVCYYGAWAHWRSAIGKLSSTDIDPFLCTHLIYSFLTIHPSFTVSPSDPYLDLDGGTRVGSLRKFIALKEKNPHLRVMISIGGWNQGSRIFSDMSLTPASRKTFIKSVIQFLDEYPFDGLDLDWEYPAQRDGRSEDRKNFLSLIKELRSAFDQRDKNMILTAAVAATKYIAIKSYDIPSLNQLLDFVNIMTYDYFGPWTYVVGHNAPLYHRKQAAFENSDLSVNASINWWIQNGMDRKKILMGIPMYGRTFTLRSAEDHMPFAISDGEGIQGNVSQIPGTLSFYESCQLQGRDGVQQYWAKDWQAPFLVDGNQWISYENSRSVKEKADYVRSQGLAGAMIWSLDHDDITGVCGKGRMPLSGVISDALNIRQQQQSISSKSKHTITHDPESMKKHAVSAQEAVADYGSISNNPGNAATSRIIVTSSGVSESRALRILLITLVNSTYLFKIND